MNKEKFLEELRGYLRVLEEQEQEDILEEYAQHIDMKLQKGLSEEEAIRDFGPMKELAAEILEAYHVKPEFGGTKPQVRMPDLKGIKIVEAGKLFEKAGGFLKRKIKACIQGIGTGFRWFGGKCCGLKERIGKIFSGRNRQKEEAPEFTGGQPGKGGYGNISKTSLWKLFLTFCEWWLRLLWNLAWLLLGFFFGGLAVFMLAGVGMGLILLPQGYPLAGVLILCVGGLLCLGALSCGSFSLMIRRKKEKPEAGEQEEAESEESEKEVEEHE